MKRIVIAGGSGFLGSLLAEWFKVRGCETVIITRTPRPNSLAREVQWDARSPGGWAAELEGAEAIINLTGRSVDCRYTAANRREILDSRVDSTRVIGAAIEGCKNPPRVWLNSSTATIYKHTDANAWTEEGETGATAEANDAFSIEVARAWEDAFFAAPAKTRKVALRTAMVLGCGRNSVYPVLSRLVRFGLGGQQGSSRQFVSWIHGEDFCRAVEWLIEHEGASGIYNICSPNPLRNAEMMRVLRRALGMPFGLPSGRWMLELGAVLLRTEAELVLKSRRVIPGRLVTEGFQFNFGTFDAAVADLKERCR